MPLGLIFQVANMATMAMTMPYPASETIMPKKQIKNGAMIKVGSSPRESGSEYSSTMLSKGRAKRLLCSSVGGFSSGRGSENSRAKWRVILEIFCSSVSITSTGTHPLIRNALWVPRNSPEACIRSISMASTSLSSLSSSRDLASFSISDCSCFSTSSNRAS